MARATGYPIVPVGFGVDRAWRLKSWDQFTIPKPFARLHVHYGEPVSVAAQVGDDELEALAGSLRTQLLAAEQQAAERLARR